MNKLYVTRGAAFTLDTENNNINRLNSERICIDDIYIMKEATHVIYGNGDKHYEEDVEPGDLVITFYTDDFKNPMVVIKNDKWAENIVKYNEKIQKEKEEWAAKHKECCDCCTNCENDN